MDIKYIRSILSRLIEALKKRNLVGALDQFLTGPTVAYILVQVEDLKNSQQRLQEVGKLKMAVRTRASCRKVRQVGRKSSI